MSSPKKSKPMSAADIERAMRKARKELERIRKEAGPIVREAREIAERAAQRRRRK